MKAIIMTAGDAQSYGNFFVAGWEYLAGQLEQLGIDAANGPALSDHVESCMAQLRDASEGSQLLIILSSPQPRTAAMISAVVAKGLGLSLEKSNAAEECILFHAAKLGVSLSPDDLSAFAVVPTGAATLKNPSGFFQGYAISSRRQLMLVLPATPSELQSSYSSYVEQLISRFISNRQTVAAPPVTAPPPPSYAVQSRAQQVPEPSPKTEADSVVEVCRALERAGLTVATAESGTSGALAQTLGSCQSRAFAPGAAFSGREQLQELDIPNDLIAQYGTVSPQAATALALAARSHAGTHLGVAITLGTPHGGTAAAAYLAVTDGQRVWRKSAEGRTVGSPQLRLGAVLGALGILNLYANGQGLPEGSPVGQELEAPTSAGIKGKLLGMMNQTARTPKPKGSEPETMAKKTNLLQRLRAGKTTRNDKVRLAAVVLFLGIFTASMVYISSVYAEAGNNITLSEDLRNMLGSDKIPDSIKDKYPKDYLTKFAALYEQNTDVAGWVKIPNTKVDYVTVQGGDNLYYERRDFTQKDNQHGVVFVDYRVDQKEPSNNTILYAHNMDDGQMFGELMNYKGLSYYKDHPVVEYDSVYREDKYVIFGVVICKMNDPDFNYHNYIDMDDKEMSEYVTKIRERSLFNTGVDVRTDDKLLTLSTCDYTFKSSGGENIARFAVFARKLRPGETAATIDISKAVINPSPIIPQEWTNKLNKQQADAEKKKQEEAASASSSQAAASVNKKWLFDYEVTDLSAEEQKDLSDRRQADAKKYLTNDEQATLSLDDKLAICSEREYLFSLYLASGERDGAINRRLAIAQERQDLAIQWLTAEEIRAAGSWSRIDALIKERQAGGTSNASADFIAKNLKWLDSGDSSLSVTELTDLMAHRKKQATDAGVTPAEVNAAKTWSDIQALIAGKGQGNAEKDAAAYIKSNPKWLDANDSGLTVAELKMLMAERDALAKSKLTTAEISSARTWADIQNLIYSKEQANIDKVKKDFIAANRQWISTAEDGQALDALKAMVTTRKKAAADAKITVTPDMIWEQIAQAIQDAGKKPEVPPVVPGISDKPVTPPPNTSSTPPPNTSSTPPTDPVTPPVTDPPANSGGGGGSSSTPPPVAPGVS